MADKTLKLFSVARKNWIFAMHVVLQKDLDELTRTNYT